jgi:hypothetical protein
MKDISVNFIVPILAILFQKSLEADENKGISQIFFEVNEETRNDKDCRLIWQ